MRVHTIQLAYITLLYLRQATQHCQVEEVINSGTLRCIRCGVPYGRINMRGSNMVYERQRYYCFLIVVQLLRRSLFKPIEFGQCLFVIAPAHHTILQCIYCTLLFTKSPNTQVTTTTRCYKRISTTALSEDIRSLLLSKHMSDTNYAVETIEAIVDKHAPLTKRIVTVRPHTPWYNDSIRATKCLRRQLE